MDCKRGVLFVVVFLIFAAHGLALEEATKHGTVKASVNNNLECDYGDSDPECPGDDQCSLAGSKDFSISLYSEAVSTCDQAPPDSCAVEVHQRRNECGPEQIFMRGLS